MCYNHSMLIDIPIETATIRIIVMPFLLLKLWSLIKGSVTGMIVLSPVFYNRYQDYPREFNLMSSVANCC